MLVYYFLQKLVILEILSNTFFIRIIFCKCIASATIWAGLSSPDGLGSYLPVGVVPITYFKFDTCSTEELMFNLTSGFKTNAQTSSCAMKVLQKCNYSWEIAYKFLVYKEILMSYYDNRDMIRIISSYHYPVCGFQQRFAGNKNHNFSAFIGK